MLKQLWMIQCDLCGKLGKAKTISGGYNETVATLPEGWTQGYNKEFHCCPRCSESMAKGNRFVEGN